MPVRRQRRVDALRDVAASRAEASGSRSCQNRGMRAQLGPFHLERVLGEGGMGVVYAARDERLGRSVALKTLRPAQGDPDARARLWREARAAALVAHPNVCAVYEVGEADGELFVAMELLEGEPLEQRLGGGALPAGEATDVALGVLAALEAMHARGIVHRDLKPGNVFLTPRGAKVLDFGLALPVTGVLAAPADRLTQPGMLLGTPGYMAPEQFTGDDVGPAADLFALGAILFEMLAGRPPFTGRTVLDVYHAVAHEAPPALTGSPGAVALDRVVRRALAKDPAERPASAGEMAEALRAAGAAAADGAAVRAHTVRRVLVLPFRLLRPDPEVEFLSQALPEAVVGTLAGRPGVVVRSLRTVERGPAGEEPDLESLAARAQADAVVAGSLQRAGDRLRVACRLVLAGRGDVVWSDTLDAGIHDLFGVQDEIAARVARALLPPPGPPEPPREGSRPAPPQGPVTRATPAAARPASPAAYEAFLRANQLAFNTSQLRRASDLYRAALAEDPGYAPAWARLGRVLRVMAKYGHVEPTAAYREAEAAFRRALALDPESSAAHNLFTYCEIEELGQARSALTRLLTRARARPDDPELFAGLVTALRFGGLLDASLEADRRARALDPGIRTSVTYTHLARRDFERALRYEDQDVPWVRFYALPQLGRAAEALELLREAEPLATTGVQRTMLGTIRAGLEGRGQDVERGLEALRASGFHDPEGLYLAGRHAALVRRDALALATLEHAVERGFSVPQALAADPWLDALRPEPRFQRLLEAALEGRRAARAAYREAGGPLLLGPEPDGEEDR